MQTSQTVFQNNGGNAGIMGSVSGNVTVINIPITLKIDGESAEEVYSMVMRLLGIKSVLEVTG